jgi:hypothetical protein
MDESLEDLAAQAAGVDAATADAALSVASPEAAAAQSDPAGEVASLLQVVAGILSPAFPSLAGVYDEPTCKRLGEAAAPVLVKYDLSVGQLFERWGAEITLAAVALPVTLATWRGVKADLAAGRKKADTPTPASQNKTPGGVPGESSPAETVTFQ